MNIWKQLKSSKQPFYVLAPMDDVTDTVFRQIVAKHAPADLMMTEFANADGYCSPGKQAISSRLKYEPIEGPVIAQIWGIDPKNYLTMAKDIKAMGFAGIDINMGCPVKDMIKKGACSAMIQNPSLAADVIAATKEGAGSLPVSVKTRIGFDEIDTENWIGFLLEQKLDALIVHGRTRKEMSKVPAHWEEVAKSVQLRDNISPDTVIVGNGDVMSRLEGDTRARETGADGIMIGRGIFHDLFVFSDTTSEHTQAQMLAIMADHIKLHIATWGDNKSYEPLKKFYKLYINNFAGSAKLRAQFMETKNTKEALKLIENVLSSVE